MTIKNEVIKVALISLGFALLTAVPYSVAFSHVQPEGVFSGFLINPIDGFSYLAKMRQGTEGNWQFVLPYTAEPGEGSFIFVYYLFLGQLSAATGLHTIYLYHVARIVGAALMFFTAYLFISHVIQQRKNRWAAFFFILFGAGLGWVGLPFNILASDLWIVESIPFQTAYANAHFPLATTLFLALIVLMIKEELELWKRAGITLCLSLLLAIIQPFSLITLLVFLLVWIVWEALREVSQSGSFDWKGEVGQKAVNYVVMLAGAMPVLIYDYWLTLNHPQIASWNKQNLTPSPPPIEFILGFGIPLILAVLGIIMTNFRSSRTDRLLLVWLLTQAVLIYAPFGLQRRFSHGLYFTLVAIAVITLVRLIKDPKRLRLAFLSLLILSIPSNLFVVGSGLYGVSTRDGRVVMSFEEWEAYQWISDHAEQDAVVLAGPTAGNRIPSFANVRVIYGHPFETIDAQIKEEFIELAFASDLSRTDAVRILRDHNVSYIFYGTEEREIGTPDWFDDVNLVFKSGDFLIYETSNP